MVKDTLYSVIICAVVLFGSYWLDNHGRTNTDGDLFFSYVVTGATVLSFAGAIGLGLSFALQRYFNRFLIILTATMLLASNISFVLDEHITSLSKYFEAFPAFLSVIAFLALVSLLVFKTFSAIKRDRKASSR